MQSRIAWLALLAVAILLTLALGWTGYTASDDAAYYEGAPRWLSAPPDPGDNHWTTRFPVILSLAAAILVVGKGYLAFGATALAWYFALIMIAGLFAARLGGERAGWIAAMLVATMPAVASEASTVGCDLAEALFLLSGIWLITESIGQKHGWRRPAAAGLCFGLAMISRETAALALLGFVPLFLLGRPIPRRALLIAGAAAALLLLGEMLFQGILTGDPLRRYALAFNHDSHIDRAANLEGNLLLHPAIDPLLVLLFNNDFALLFWLGIAAVGTGFHRKRDPLANRRLIVLAALGVTTFLLVSLLTTKLVLNPRYFMLPALAVAIIVAIWLAHLRARPRALIPCGAVAANLLMLSVQNAHPRWPAEALVIAAAAHPREPILTDPETYHRAKHPLAFAGLTNARASHPEPGRLYLSAEGARTVRGRVLARYPSRATPLGRLVEAAGLSAYLPAAVATRLLRPNPAMILRRLEP